jgi:FtsP/CotA-like multicopper oxidase with cupredoxin domain
MNDSTLRNAILFVFIVLPSFVLATPTEEVLAADITSKLEQEFHNSYPKNRDATGHVVEFELVAKESEWGLIPPYKTKVWSYNGTIPGPVIRLQLGDTLKLKLTNQLEQATTIHWHGVRVPNAMDGVPGVTQPAIKPGESYTYQFTPKDAGTFWFHPHVNAAEQVERGLQGVLIVEDKNDPEYSQDLVFVLDDWLLEKEAKIRSQFVTRHDLAHDGRWGNVQTVNGQYKPVFEVKAGERIRIRMINVANGRVFSPHIEAINPIVFAVDGMLAGQPFPLQNFLLAPGNRMDLDIVIAKTLTGKQLAITNSFSRTPSIIAFLQVSKQPVETADFETPKAKHFPLWREASKVPVHHEYRLNAKRGGRYGIQWTIDDNAWPNSDQYDLQAGKFYRLRFNNKSPRLHPMHLHGQFFKVIARNGKTVEENYWRDTVLLKRKETVDIAIIALDKGLWANHCHILEHAEAGMMSTFRVN